MSIYEKIYEIAADQYGLITCEEAKEIGIPNIELVKLAHRGKLEHISHGLYRISKYIPTQFDVYAEAVKTVGSDAHLYGESVLAFHGLIPTNPTTLLVSTSQRVRKTLPKHIRLIKMNTIEPTVYYEGIPSQSVANAIRACIGSIMTERLIDAVNAAKRIGLITASEEISIKKEVKNDRQSSKQ